MVPNLPGFFCRYRAEDFGLSTRQSHPTGIGCPQHDDPRTTQEGDSMSTHRFKAGDQVVRIPSSGPIRTLRTGVVAKVYKNGNFILAGDESRQQYRQTGFRTGQHGGCDAYWVAKDSDEVHQAIESAKLARHRGEARELLDRLSNLVSRDTKKDWSELVKGLEDLLGSAQSGEVQS